MSDTIENAPKKRGPKPRDRSAAGLSVVEAHREGIIMGDTRDPNTAVEQERVRIPMNAGQNQSLRGYKLDWENFHYKWFHESQTRAGRVAKAQEAFYEHCLDPQGNAITTPSGAGTDYLMRLPKKYWLDDMRESRMRREAARKAEERLGKNEYAVDRHGRPVDEGEVIVQRSVSDNPYA